MSKPLWINDKYNAYIPTLSTGSFVAESAYPNYYPAMK
jgi:hypothetical protein